MWKKVTSVAMTICLTCNMPLVSSKVQADSLSVENAVIWAIGIANDNTHGYTANPQDRWGPDYDCSSFVIAAFKVAGFDTGSAYNTGSMKGQLTQHGFVWIPWSEIGSTANLQRGDILLNETQHTEIYIGNNQNVGAHSSYGDTQTGDQSGKEVSVVAYYSQPWNGVLRYAGQTANESQTTDNSQTDNTGNNTSASGNNNNNSNNPADNNNSNGATNNTTNNGISTGGGTSGATENVTTAAAADTCNCVTSYAGNYVVATDDSPLLMRSGHGTGFSKVTSIPKGATVKVTKANGSWAHVEWNGYKGYSSMLYLKKADTANKKNTGSGANAQKLTSTSADNINKYKASITKIKNKAKGSVRISIGKNVKADGFQIKYALNKKVTKKKKDKNVTSYATDIKNLKRNKTYYFKVRAYKLCGGVATYSKWSDVKKKKVK
ncbi:MAG: SH3 domain-containing protein [Lachnospiraceae bacterium]|nr:SH3 domain-containing protein [Lachnospiraceae bacterium]